MGACFRFPEINPQTIMRIIILLALLTAFPAMSMDMYLPALPTIQKMWHASLTEANLTLSIFMITNALAILVYGPLSDRFGRRPVLLAGLALYFGGSIACALSPSIHALMAARAMQASGAGSATALTMAIARDLFVGSQRQRVLAYVGIIFALVPMLAPTIGGFMLNFASWRWIFGVQALLCTIAIIWVYRLQEPLKQFTRGGILAVAGRYLVVLRNVRFVALVVIFAIMVMPLFAYIGSAAEIYINGFGLSAQQFGLHFGIISAGIMFGSLFAAKTAERLTSYQTLSISMGGLLACSVAMLIIAPDSAMTLTPVMLCTLFFVGINRPLSMHMVLEAVDSDAGTASSILTFSIMVTGGVTMGLVSMDVGNRVELLTNFLLAGTIIPVAGLVGYRLLAGKKSA